MDRLFVPLTKQSFEDFRKGKIFEVRILRRQWSKKNVRSGRHVTLSCGYSGPRIEGKVGQVLTGSLGNIIRRLPFHKIEPRAKSKTEAVRMNLEILGEAEEYIAFEIKF